MGTLLNIVCGVFFFFTFIFLGPKGVASSSDGAVKNTGNSIIHEDECLEGKARSALWCISLIYYLTDFQTIILRAHPTTTPTPLVPLLFPSNTCDIRAGLSAFPMGYNIFGSLPGGGGAL